jgi:hypothetical protein
VFSVDDDGGYEDVDHPSWAVGVLASNVVEEKYGLGIAIELDERTVIGPDVDLYAADRVIVNPGAPKAVFEAVKSYPVLRIRRKK